MLEIAKLRLASGESPRATVREALCAGVPSAALRKAVNVVYLPAKRRENARGDMNIMGIALGLLTGTFVWSSTASDVQVENMDGALADLAEWDRRLESAEVNIERA